jgi:hypothetical protein
VNYPVKPLDVNTWDAFSRLVERHNGIFGGCWCTWFHTFHGEKTFTAEGNHALKKRLVEDGRASAGFDYIRAKGKRNCVMRKAVR